VELGFGIPILSRIPDSSSCIPNSKAQDSLFQSKNLSVNVFSTKLLIGDTILTSPSGDGPAILRMIIIIMIIIIIINKKILY